MAELRITIQVLKVLDALLEGGDDERYGFELSKVTGLKSGTLYPILARLEAAGWLTSGWENPDDSTGRPRRRYYRLTGVGAEAAKQHLADLPGRYVEVSKFPQPTRRPVPTAARPVPEGRL